jgi:ATP-dependent DNA helicase RecG
MTIKTDDLPFNIDNIIFNQTVESTRVEFKKEVDDKNALYIGATLCAFANDMYNIDGGWIIIGIEAPDGNPMLPPVGIPLNKIEKFQKDIRVLGKTLSPSYHPYIYATHFQEKPIIVIYAPAGDERPYTAKDPRAPEKYEYFIREGAETTKADKDTQKKLIELCSKVPFDDRIHLAAKIEDISPLLVKNFLTGIESQLLHKNNIDLEVLKSMRIVSPFHDTFSPKNIALLMFNQNPETFFDCCYFEVVQFENAKGDVMEEKKFTGPINAQISEVLSYLNNMSGIQIQKIKGKAEVDRFCAFPYDAMEEAIVNAAYHRSYDSHNEPCKIYLYPDRMEIISYPGPVEGIEPEDFIGDNPLPPVPLRNRRIGEFLKELRLAEMRSTGVPKIKQSMKANGSAEPQFVFDKTRSYFKVVLPAHPKFLVVHTLREASFQWSIGERNIAKDLLFGIFEKNPGNGSIAGQLIEYYYNSSEEGKAEDVFQRFNNTTVKSETEQPYLRYFRCLINNRKEPHAQKVIDFLDAQHYFDHPLDVAIAFKRVKEYEKSHIVFSRVISQNENNFDYLRNFAEVKISLANEMRFRRTQDWPVIKRLQREACDLLQKAISLGSDNTSLAWCYFNLARVKNWLRLSPIEVKSAYESAIHLLPNEEAFEENYQRYIGKNTPN